MVFSVFFKNDNYYTFLISGNKLILTNANLTSLIVGICQPTGVVIINNPSFYYLFYIIVNYGILYYNSRIFIYHLESNQAKCYYWGTLDVAKNYVKD